MRRVVVATRLVVALLVVLCLLVLAASAQAIYGPAAGGLGADIVSVDRASDEQADAGTSDADVSANGRYVVFQTKATNFFENDGVADGDPEPPGACREGGIFRYDRDTGELALVADGTEVGLNSRDECDPSDVLIRGAQNPSVSADGRYIAFSTAQQLVPQDTNQNVDVYVRDMDVSLTADRKDSDAYKLVSAQNGSEEPPVYENSLVGSPLPGGNPGSEVWPNSAISADGEYVLFRTAELPSSLTTVPEPDQLFVRDLRTHTTTLVTRRKIGEPEAGGAAGGASGPASLSADGSTVTWVGTHALRQTIFLRGEEPQESAPYYLWQRWQEPAARTRRITGIADPEAPGCEAGEVTLSPIANGPCYGPLTYPEASQTGGLDSAPSLSADGYTVAFLTGSGLRPNTLKADVYDLFVTSMRPGVTRKAGTRELTLAVNGARGDGNAPVTSLAMSADGSHIAFVSQRNAFVLSEPAAVGNFSQSAQESELNMIDLSSDTLERAIVGFEGAEPNGSTLANPTLDEDGSVVAFTSEASDLIFGDANKATDGFAATLQSAGGTAGAPPGVNAGSGGFSLTALSSPELGVSVKRAKDGGITLLVETPGPGKLTAKARGLIPKSTFAKNAKKASASDVPARASQAKTKKQKVPPPVLLSSASATARSEGTTTLTLHISSKYVKDLKRAGKLKANIMIAFTPPAPAEALSDEVSATFATASPAKKPSGKGKGKR